MMNPDSMVAPAQRRRERERQAREADIVHHAEAVFGEKGYFRASIEEIAQRAEVGTGTVYLHFSDKETLYARLVAEKMALLVERLELLAGETLDPIARLRRIVGCHLTFFEENRAFFTIFVRERFDRQPGTSGPWAEVARLCDERLKHVQDAIEAGQQAGLLREESGRLAAVALTGLMCHLIRDGLEGNEGVRLDRFGPLVERLFLHGLATGSAQRAGGDER